MKRVFAFIGFSTAITLIVLNLIDYSFSALVFSSAAVFLIASLLIKRTRQAKVLPVVLGSAVFACLIFMLVNSAAVQPTVALDGCKARTQFQIVDIPEYNVYTGKYTYPARAKCIEYDGAPQDIKIKITTKDKLECDYYDTVTADLSYYTFANSVFNSYGDYGEGVYVRATLGEIYNAEATEKKTPNYYFILFRERIFEFVSSNFRGDTAGVSIALLTGDKSYLSQKAIDNFRICGVSHFLAVSGFHISLICLSLYAVLKFFRTPKLLRVLITLSAMLLYCGAADFSSSSLRAAIMVSVMLVSRLLSAKSDSLNSLGFATFLICLNPFSVTDAGTVLTVSATLGIFAVYTPVSGQFSYSNKFVRRIESASLLSLCIMLCIIPAMYVFFGNLSVGSILFNLFVEPLIIVIIVSLLLFAMLFGVAPAAVVLSKAVGFSAKLLLGILDFGASEFSVFYGDFSDSLFAIAIAAVFFIMGVLLLIYKKVPVRRMLAVVTVLGVATLSLSLFQNAQSAGVYIDESAMVIVYNADSAVAVGMYDYYDKSAGESLIRDKTAVYIDSPQFSESLRSDEDYTDIVGSEMQLDITNGIVKITVFDKEIEIHQHCVIIDNNRFERGGNSALTVSFTRSSQLAIRREAYG